MLVTQSAPVILREAVLSAVQDGAWTPADVVAAVATDSTSDRRFVIATLWDLAAEGFIRYDASLNFAGFRPCC